MKNNISLDKKDIKNAAWTWIFFHHCAQNYERMMGVAYGHTLSKSLEKLYGDDKEGLSEALKRNITFFNTEPQIGSVIPGITLALEEKIANDKSFDSTIVANTKNALMGPLAGIGDSLLIGTLNPILLSIGIGLSQNGSPIGPIVFLAIWLGIVLPMKYLFFIKGYDLGLDVLKYLNNEKLKRIITTTLTIIGLIVIGGVASTTVAANLKLEFVQGEMIISLQAIFDRIMPKMLPLFITLVSYHLVTNKKWSANKLLIAIFAFTAVMVLFKIM